MNARQRIQSFSRRWKIRLDEGDGFYKFRNRIANRLDLVLGKIILNQPEITRDFLFFVGAEHPPESSTEELPQLVDIMGEHIKDNEIYIAIAEAPTLERLVTALQYLFLVLEQHRIGAASVFADEVHEAITISPSIDVRIVQRGKQVLLYPGGAKLLDEKVVNETLGWLDDYPQVSKHLEEALRIYQTKDAKKYRNLLDNLRVAVEQLLRALLKNRKSLENQTAPLTNWLEAHGVHKQVQNMYSSLLFGPYAMYQNDAVKHGDESSPVEVEFMIYQTGTLLRFLLQVNQETAHGA